LSAQNKKAFQKTEYQIRLANLSLNTRDRTKLKFGYSFNHEYTFNLTLRCYLSC